MRNIELSLVPVRDWCENLGAGAAFLVYVAVATALQFYKQTVLRDTAPIAFAAIVKTIVGMAFFAAISYKTLTREGPGPLFAHEQHIGVGWRAVFVAAICVLGAATLALDTLAFVYLDLTTKQVIDSATPVTVLIASLLLTRVLRGFEPDTYAVISPGRTRNTLTVSSRRAGWKRVRVARAACIVLMVVGSCLTVWATPEVSTLGLIVNGTTLVTAAVTIVLVEHLLKWAAYSQFSLMIVTIIPEVAILGILSWQLGEEPPSARYLWSAGIVAAAELLLKVVAFFLLRVTSSVELSVANVGIFVSVIVLDTLRAGGTTTVRYVALSLTFIVVAVYTGLGYAWRSRALERDPGLAPVQPLEVHKFGGFGDTGLPAWGVRSHENVFGPGKYLSEPSESTSTEGGSSSSGDTDETSSGSLVGESA